jgi:hypothetical protein
LVVLAFSIVAEFHDRFTTAVLHAIRTGTNSRTLDKISIGKPDQQNL